MLTVKTLPALDALALTSGEYDRNVTVSKGAIKTRAYSFKVSADGTISYRWGVLVTAAVLFDDGRPVVGSAVYNREASSRILNRDGSPTKWSKVEA